ncbi:6578_t:CDS:1, partial [Ambispora leptoticha]
MTLTTVTTTRNRTHSSIRAIKLVKGHLSFLLTLLIFSNITTITINAQGLDNIPLLAAHSAAMVKNNMVIFGGIEISNGIGDIYNNYSVGGTNQLYVWNADAHQWSAPKVQGSIPLAQKFAPAVTTQSDNIIMVQLTNANSAAESLVKLDTSGWTWVTAPPAPP